MADSGNVAKGLRERLGGNPEDRLGKALSDLLESPLLAGAVGRAFDAREKASQAQEVAFGALNIPSAADIERLTRRLRSVSHRLEGIEDGVDRLDRALAPSGIEARLSAIEAQLRVLTERFEEGFRAAAGSAAAGSATAGSAARPAAAGSATSGPAAGSAAAGSAASRAGAGSARVSGAPRGPAATAGTAKGATAAPGGPASGTGRAAAKPARRATPRAGAKAPKRAGARKAEQAKRTDAAKAAKRAKTTRGSRPARPAA